MYNTLYRVINILLINVYILTRMHSSRMRTARSLIIRGVSARGVCPCDLSHHAFDVTCVLPPHPLSVNTSAAAYIVRPRCMLGYHTFSPPPVNRMTDRCKNNTVISDIERVYFQNPWVFPTVRSRSSP